MSRLQKLIILPFVMVACATSQSPRSLVLHVSNELGRSIAEIHKKSCGDLDISYSPIEGSRFSPGERRGLVLPSTCVDLIAYDSRGRVVGEQLGLEMLSDASWAIRR